MVHFLWLPALPVTERFDLPLTPSLRPFPEAVVDPRKKAVCLGEDHPIGSSKVVNAIVRIPYDGGPGCGLGRTKQRSVVSRRRSLTQSLLRYCPSPNADAIMLRWFTPTESKRILPTAEDGLPSLFYSGQIGRSEPPQPSF